jgi:hypothetical protein
MVVCDALFGAGAIPRMHLESIIVRIRDRLLAGRAQQQQQVVLVDDDDDDDMTHQDAIVALPAAAAPTQDRRADIYMHHDREALVHTLVKQDATIDELRAKVKSLQQQKRRLQNRVAQVESRP